MTEASPWKMVAHARVRRGHLGTSSNICFVPQLRGNGANWRAVVGHAYQARPIRSNKDSNKNNSNSNIHSSNNSSIETLIPHLQGNAVT